MSLRILWKIVIRPGSVSLPRCSANSRRTRATRAVPGPKMSMGEKVRPYSFEVTNPLFDDFPISVFSNNFAHAERIKIAASDV
jgi:hypothetical protein